MNLDDLNLVELNAQEVQEVEGGRTWAQLWYYLTHDSGTHITD